LRGGDFWTFFIQGDITPPKKEGIKKLFRRGKREVLRKTREVCDSKGWLDDRETPLINISKQPEAKKGTGMSWGA